MKSPITKEQLRQQAYALVETLKEDIKTILADAMFSIPFDEMVLAVYHMPHKKQSKFSVMWTKDPEQMEEVKKRFPNLLDSERYFDEYLPFVLQFTAPPYTDDTKFYTATLLLKREKYLGDTSDYQEAIFSA